MAYEVLARKWRPQQFDEVVGQEHVARTLKNAIESGRIAHAYLFVGPRGIGKTSSARIFAKALNCAKGPTATPCDQCDACREIMDGRSLDVIEIDGASNTGVDHIRDLRESVLYAPARGPYKIYIIDEVHMLSTGAFNALLKTLEEPPKHVKFIFATTEPQKLPATIISRCQRFDLRPISTRQIMQHLRKIADAEKVKVSDDALLAVARGAEGGMRDAESTLDQLMAFCGDSITEDDVMSVFGLVSRAALEELVDAMIAGEVPKAIAMVDELDQSGKDVQRVVVELLQYLRNLLVLSYSTDQGAGLDVTDLQRERLRGQAEHTDASRILRMIKVLSEADEKLRYALSRRALLEVAVIQCARSARVVSIDRIIGALAELKKQLGGEGVAPSTPPVSAAPARVAERSAATDGYAALQTQKKTPDLTGELEMLRLRWRAIMDSVGRHFNLHARNCLLDADPLEVTEAMVRVGFDPQFASEKNEMEVSSNRHALAHVLSDALGRRVAVDFSVLPGKGPMPSDISMTPRESDDPGAAVKVSKAGQSDMTEPTRLEWMKNPKVLLTLESFNGDIVDIRI
ncbi:MAG: DNA polymerase III subunit gamma/tau [Kiritimatiellae bacterium]|nr:DNA polymerase III subunit gamma/tau [Kiritimatiellia bacterium]